MRVIAVEFRDCELTGPMVCEIVGKAIRHDVDELVIRCKGANGGAYRAALDFRDRGITVSIDVVRPS